MDTTATRYPVPVSTGNPPFPAHVPVLKAEVLAALAPLPGQTALDCTAGLGGHSIDLAGVLGQAPGGTLILNDLDSGNLELAAARVQALSTPPRIVKLQGNFADAPRRLAEQGLSADLVLADLGFASPQIENASRGFSFQREGPLDMRYDPASGRPSAADLVNTLPEAELAEIIRDLGEERHWRRVAAKLVEQRQADPILTTSRLASIVRSVVRSSPADRIDPATRTFQALRIAVNDELGSLASLLESISRAAVALALTGKPTAPGADTRPASWLRPGARIGIISFHSLEDRMVKRAFLELTERGLGRLSGRKPIEATDGESSTNPRARSAKLRALTIV